ncbi:MAG: hypothetical protein Q9191_005157 [Dirinaria sp. TL-2023a]
MANGIQMSMFMNKFENRGAISVVRCGTEARMHGVESESPAYKKSELVLDLRDLATLFVNICSLKIYLADELLVAIVSVADCDFEKTYRWNLNDMFGKADQELEAEDTCNNLGFSSKPTAT